MSMEWMNEPPTWSHENGTIVVTTGDNTDFWSRTFYGFRHSTGHLRYGVATGDFSVEVTVSASYEQLYDQAGLMLLVDDENWLKCGIEYTDSAMHFSTVVTRDGYSDWSQQIVANEARKNLRIRLTRHQEALRVQFKTHTGYWTMARLAMLSYVKDVKVGVMCCTPKRAGLVVKFEDFVVAPAISRDLHE